jgi:hypothetical protein
MPRLNWGLLAAFDPGQPGAAPPDLAREWQVAEQSLGLVARPTERFELAGTLNDHPGHARSDEAKKDFPAIFALAVAGLSAPEPLRARSWAAAAAALLAWTRTYRLTGNPLRGSRPCCSAGPGSSRPAGTASTSASRPATRRGPTTGWPGGC